MRSHFAGLLEQFQGVCRFFEVHYDGFILGVTQFAGGGDKVGADVDVHRQFPHIVAKSIDSLNIATHKQGPDSYVLRGHAVSFLDLDLDLDAVVAARAGKSLISQAPLEFPSLHGRRRAQMRRRPRDQSSILRWRRSPAWPQTE